MNLYIVIAVFNRVEITLKCLSLFREQTYKNFKIVLVDDGSSDGTSERVSKEYPEVKIVCGNGNWWWTRSMNEGIKIALNDGADAVLIMNNDTIFDSDYLEKIVAIAQQNPDAVIGSLDVTREEPRKIFFSGVKKIIWWKAKGYNYHNDYELYDPEEITGLHESVALNGRGTLIPRKVWDAIGLMDEKGLPQYASDFDIVLRANKAGFKTYISWDAVVYSYVAETGEGKPFIKQSIWKFFRTFFKKYSQTSLSTWYNYYKKYCKWYYFPFAFGLQMFKLVYSFYKRRNAFQ